MPPTTTLTGQGSLSGLTLGKVTYGPSMGRQLPLPAVWCVPPFLGTGITYTVIFGTQDNAIVNLRVNNSIGAVIRTGFDVMFSDRWGHSSVSAKSLSPPTPVATRLSPL